ncbi:MAG: GntR family transcriptional regulator [Pseudomonadales bacterium]
MVKVESCSIDAEPQEALPDHHPLEASNLSTITDTTFTAIFESLATGRDSSDRVLLTIIEGLLDGRYKPGQRVVARQLAEELGVSIVPVREAIHILAGEGVVELSARKGARIRALDKEEVGNWWEIHGSVGRLGVRFAAQRIGEREDSVAKVLDAMDLIREQAGKLEGFDFVMVLLRFHMVMHDVARMPELNEATRRLGIFFWAIFFPEYIPMRDYGESYIRNHQRVTDAIINGDPVAAEAAYQYHIDWTDALIAGERPDQSKPWVHHKSR